MITLALPFPVSLNAIWRNVRGRTLLSSDARAWWSQADGMFLTQKRFMPPADPLEWFEAELTFDASRRGRNDLDNLAKLPLDAAQKFGLIRNDKLCNRLTSSWGKADGGCLLTLRGAKS